MIISNLKSQHRYLQCKFVMFRLFQHLCVHPSYVKRWLRETFFWSFLTYAMLNQPASCL